MQTTSFVDNMEVTHYYANFRRSPYAYATAQKHWRSLIIRELVIHGLDYQVINLGWGDYTPHRPIIQVYCPSLKKMIEIIQVDPASKTVEITTWIGDSDVDGVSVPTLTVYLAMSEETMDIVELLLIPTWFILDYTLDQIHGVITLVNACW